MFAGGDWIPLSLPQRAREWRSDVRFVSVGGPTETTLWNIWHEVANVANRADAALLADPDQRERAAGAIVEALLAFFAGEDGPAIAAAGRLS